MARNKNKSRLTDTDEIRYIVENRELNKVHDMTQAVHYRRNNIPLIEKERD